MGFTEGVLLLGDPKLREVSKRVDNVKDAAFLEVKDRLFETLERFRRENGFGRGISAIQIGEAVRLIALNLGKGTFSVINPEITYKSEETFTMLDDCFSFPLLLVKVRRHKRISITYTNDEGKRVEWNHIDQASSELLQHEINHLDGVLAVDLAEKPSDIINRSDYEKDPAKYNNLVDYVIVPTIPQA
eukprot:TRINITY_DN1271_c0_g1_i2.p1 TRINITY_DN1271_c0_g1~~TRINITY_DN1271_c0_g1_i2.p1  ORF type:complete len:188 (+),score=38.29 TRINITY_DN1271_c0_g1_i2:148-711(+)